MSFGVSSEASGIEYCASDLGHVLRPEEEPRQSLGHLRMMLEILKFRRRARRAPRDPGPGYNPSLGDFLRDGGFSERFQRGVHRSDGRGRLVRGPGRHEPLPGALPDSVLREPSLPRRRCDQLPWRTVRREAPAPTSIAIARSSVTASDSARPSPSVRRADTHVEIVSNGTGRGVRSRRALRRTATRRSRCSKQPTPAEREILGAIPYQPNDTVLHTDVSLMPGDPKGLGQLERAREQNPRRPE